MAARRLSLLLLLFIPLSLQSTTTALRFSEDINDFFQQDALSILSPVSTPTPTPLFLPFPPPSSSPLSDSGYLDSEGYADGPLSPAFFIFGDSSVDCGTNNFLGTLARADRPPYGRDFDNHQPTGRFCNGRLAVDYLALRLGLPFVPSYLGQNGSFQEMVHGVNYASAGAGLIFTSGSELGQHISFTQQIQQFRDTFQEFILNLGEEMAINLISDSVFYISIGTNDYIHYYLRNVSGVQSRLFPWNFNKFLIDSIKQEIKNLYDSSVRKVVVMGLAPMGCAPYYLWKYNSAQGECIQDINDMTMEFNFGMRYMVDELNKELRNATVIFCDVFEAAMELIQNHQRYEQNDSFNLLHFIFMTELQKVDVLHSFGSVVSISRAGGLIGHNLPAPKTGFLVTTDACCGLGKYKGWIVCISPLMACHNASTHIWWDQFHPTDAVNRLLADGVWSGLHTKMCYPITMKEMVTQDDR